MGRFSIDMVHISEVRAGYTVIQNGEEMTVCQGNIKRDPFMGLTLFGDSYRLGTLMVQSLTYTPAKRA
jgi:hypothetical protein